MAGVQAQRLIDGWMFVCAGGGGPDRGGHPREGEGLQHPPAGGGHRHNSLASTSKRCYCVYRIDFSLFWQKWHGNLERAFHRNILAPCILSLKI